MRGARTAGHRDVGGGVSTILPGRTGVCGSASSPKTAAGGTSRRARPGLRGLRLLSLAWIDSSRPSEARLEVDTPAELATLDQMACRARGRL